MQSRKHVTQAGDLLDVPSIGEECGQQAEKPRNVVAELYESRSRACRARGDCSFEQIRGLADNLDIVDKEL
jgi:hypothetical protein